MIVLGWIVAVACMWAALVCLVLFMFAAVSEDRHPTPTPTERDRVHAERRKWTH